ncbi:hypothetical protein NHX12_021218 [Muraenolepis orangiensis]|uniref:UBX domain-containing protein 1 n=1 Tax=Muraenolepis orangiensis TaxID=630683 RepID=A0A9Q0IS48_9TELE|nr:hypothetical protein NHX12_021218 [Muraenolepis orangiensis]
MDSPVPPTIGALFVTLGEMGFTKDQIQGALQAGHFSVADAAEWLLQAQTARHKLLKRPSEPVGSAFSAFNPPKEQGGAGSHDGSADSGASRSLSLRSPPPPEASSSSGCSPPDPLPPLESRIKPPQGDFQEQQRQRVAQEAQEVRAERRQKKQERELVLKRIAEDRRIQQEKTKAASSAEESQTTKTSGAQKLGGGALQTNVDNNNCILMIRLPSGESMRERFHADAPLRTVVEHISELHPSLPAFSLLQGFPRKRFGEAELACSLRSLGLMPNTALCLQTTPPGATPPGTTPPPLPAAAPAPVVLWEEAAGFAGIPGAPPPFSGPSHFWGRGQKLAPVDAGEAAASEEEEDGHEELEADREEEPPFMPGMPRLPFLPDNRLRGGGGPRHQWPQQGNILREGVAVEEAAPEEAGMRVGPGAAGLAAVERLQRAEPHQGLPSPPKKAYRAPSVTSLCSMATRATAQLMAAPSMQYSSSLACLTPELAELLLSHMARERLLRPRTLELFFGCPLQKFVLNSYPYSTNDLLRQLRAFPALKHLSLVNSPLITDSGLSVLSSLVRLQHLNLSSCGKLSDCCLQYITGVLPYLRSAPPCLSQLSLNNTAITEATLAALPPSVPHLRFLSIKQTKVSDVSSLAELLHLQTLYLDGTLVTEVSLEPLACHPSLAALSVAGIPVQDPDHALHLISGLRLSQLTLPGRNSVTDRGLSFLSRLGLLTELDLTDYTQVTDQGVSQLASMTSLKKLSLSNTGLTDAGLAPLRSLRELQELCLDRTAVTSRGVATLITCLPHLQVLGLACTQVGDSVVRRGLIGCRQLVKLNLSRTRITDRGLKLLRHVHLAQVNLDGTGVTLTGLLSLSHIASVRASNTRSIAPADVSDDESQ